MRLRVIGWSVGAAALAVVIASLGWGLTHPANKAPATLVGAPAPALAIRTFDGVEYDLGQLRGTPIVINFWASWCVACRLEAPVLRAAANRYAGRIQFLGIDIQDSDQAALAFEAESVCERTWFRYPGWPTPSRAPVQLPFGCLTRGSRWANFRSTFARWVSSCSCRRRCEHA